MARHRRKDYLPEKALDPQTLQTVREALVNHMEENPEEGTLAMLGVVEKLLKGASDG